MAFTEKEFEENIRKVLGQGAKAPAVSPLDLRKALQVRQARKRKFKP